uniref:Uncharacterized protein n=1 Tax=Arundo donax TaxID=35708 RepID=A0A0A9EEU2_ARUDO
MIESKQKINDKIHGSIILILHNKLNFAELARFSKHKNLPHSAITHVKLILRVPR